MGKEEIASKDAVEKMSALNAIFEDVISDATDLIKDLSWSVKTYLLCSPLVLNKKCTQL